MRNIEREALEELDYEEDYYAEDDQPEQTQIDDELANQLIDRVYEVLGDGEFDEDAVWSALEKNAYDPEAAVDFLLNPPAAKPKPKKLKNLEKSTLE